MKRRSLYWIAPSMVLIALGACSSKPNEGTNASFAASAGGGAGSSGAGGSFMVGGLGGSSGGGASSTEGGSSTGCTAVDLTMCGGEDHAIEEMPIDMFIMLDQSTSMAEMLPNNKTRWENVTAALNLYLSQGAPTTLRVGMQYFGLGTLAGCQAPGDGGSTDWSQCGACNVAQYNSAAVAIQDLGAAGPAISASMAMHSPSTFTPTAAAVEGGLQFARTWANAHSERRMMFVLVTDGYPTQCDIQDIGGIGAIVAKETTASPPILTVVVGVGNALSNLETLAVKGGSKHAILVPDSGDATQLIVDGLTKISRTPFSCHLKTPLSNDGGMVDFNKVNVQFNAKDNTKNVLCFLPQGSFQCMPNGGGWYYEDDAKSKIGICPETCDNFPPGSLSISVGCKTIQPQR